MSTYSLTLRQDLSRPLTCQEMDNNLLYLRDLALEHDMGNYEQTVGTPVTITSGNSGILVSLNITTMGNPVQLIATGDANPTTGAGAWATLKFHRDGSPIGNTVQVESSATNENIPFALNFIDEVVAGTYTYTLEVTNTAGSDFDFGEVDGPVMTAVELSVGTAIASSGNEVVGSQFSNALGGCNNMICGDSAHSTIIGGHCNYISCYSEDSSIIGGNYNVICDSSNSAIIGGCCNIIDSGGDDYNAIIAGCDNRICGGVDYSAIVAGHGNVIYGDADADYSAILAGCCNYNSHSEYGIIAGGACNQLYCYSDYSGIFAGCCNEINENSCFSTIMGGCDNDVCCSNYSSIIGGCCNRVLNQCESVIIGGRYNCIVLQTYAPSYCFVSGNAIVGAKDSCINETDNSVIVGGKNHYIGECADYSAIVGGRGNEIYGADTYYSAIVAGSYNCICYSSSDSAIVAGCGNIIYYSCKSVVGGGNNYIYCSSYSSILSGCCNSTCCVISSSIVSGYGNYICCQCNSAIVGGEFNCIEGWDGGIYCNNTIVGGRDNCIAQYAGSNTIVNGCDNRIDGESYYNAIVAGERNCLNYAYCSSVVSGCDNRICDSSSSVIMGGEENCIDNNGRSNIIAGGCCNYMCCGCMNAIVGGYYNSMERRTEYSTILGGCCNQICGGFGSCYFGAPFCTTCYSCGIVCQSAIVSGEDNEIYCGVRDSVIIGGRNNTIRGCATITPYGINCERSCHSAIIGGSNNIIDYSFKSAIVSSSAYYYNNYVRCSRNSTIMSSYTYNGSRIVDSCQSSIISTYGEGSYICSGNANAIIGHCNGSIEDSYYSVLLGGFDNTLRLSDGSSIMTGRYNSLCSSNDSAILGSKNSLIISSTHSVILGGNGHTLNGVVDTILIPTLTTATFSSVNYSKWKLGATSSTGGTATLNQDQYVEVEINGVTYKIALVN